MLTTLLVNVGFLTTSGVNDVGALLAARAFDGGKWLLDETNSTMDFNGGDVICRSCGSDRYLSTIENYAKGFLWVWGPNSSCLGWLFGLVVT